MAKRFFFVSAGLLLLAAAYNLGVSTATAQAPTGEIVAATYDLQSGSSVPLPTYADGTEANPLDCVYALHGCSAGLSGSNTVKSISFYLEARGDGTKTFHADVSGVSTSDHGSGSVTVIAIRGSGTTPTVRASWGALKAKAR